MKTIYILGSLNMDLAIETNRIPNKGETLAGKNFKTCPGGKGLNQAIAASKLGAKVKMLGSIGNDVFGREMFEKLKEYKVDVSHIKINDRYNSGVAVIILKDSDNRIILDLGANMHILKKDVDDFLLKAKKGDIFLSQLENDIDLIGYALKKAKQKKMITVINPAPANIKINKYLGFVDIFVPNSIELQTFLKGRKIENCVRNLGISNIIETRGKDGYRYYSKNEIISGKAMKVNVVDTTGAGDCFVGALVSKLAVTEKIDKEILDFACKAASLSTTKKGSSASSPTLEDLSKL